MSEVRVLILDWEKGNLSPALSQILQSADNSDFRIKFTSLNNSLPVQDLCSQVRETHSDLMAFLLAPSQLGQAVYLIPQFKKNLPHLSLLAVFEGVQAEAMFELLKTGIDDFVIPPLRDFEIIPRLRRLSEKRALEPPTMQKTKETLGLKQLVGQSVPFINATRKIPLLARCDVSILLCGETGTGKELCARAIHYLSPRSRKPFIPVNCGAIPVELVENELFGHERGAFTGATYPKTGLVEEAEGGTLFLDEIDCLPLSAQAKLLRFLQEKEYRALGSKKMIKADVRVFAATNIDFHEAVKSGKLRQDLYYRLNVISLEIPPLRERQEDVPLLAKHFLKKYSYEFNKPVTDFSSEAMQLLLLYEWPGNVRELEHTIERAVVFSDNEVIEETEIMLPSRRTNIDQSFHEAKARVIAAFEKTYIERLLLIHHGNISKAARAAHKNRRAFWELLRKHKVDAQYFKS
jgi:two-component system response regulator GlrR